MSQLKGWRTLIFNAGMVLLSGGTVSAAAEGFLTPQQLELAFTIISSAWGFGSLIFRIYTTTPLGQKTVATVEGWSTTNLGMPVEQFLSQIWSALHGAATKEDVAASTATIATKVEDAHDDLKDVQETTGALHEALVPSIPQRPTPTPAQALEALRELIESLEQQEADRVALAKPNVLEAIAAAQPMAPTITGMTGGMPATTSVVTSYPPGTTISPTLASPDPSAPAAPVGASVHPTLQP
jgi:hypothetical protein